MCFMYWTYRDCLLYGLFKIIQYFKKYMKVVFINHIFSSPEHKVLRVSYCDRPLSVVRRRASCVVRRASSVVRKLFYLNIFSSETTHWILTKLYRNDPWVVPYQSCSNGSDWLHKKVTGSKCRFSKCNFQKSSCLKLQGPEISYLVYNII